MEKHISSRLQALLHLLLVKVRAEDLKGIENPPQGSVGYRFPRLCLKILAVRSSTGAFFTFRLVIGTDGLPAIFVPTKSLPPSQTPGRALYDSGQLLLRSV